MMGKLLKHEWKATFKTFFYMYAVLLVIFITAFLGKGLNINHMREFAIFAMSCAVLPVIMIYFVSIVNRYQKNIYGAEGYLTNTLPVKTWEILLTKLMSATVWGFLTLFVGLVFGISMMWALDVFRFINFHEVVRELGILIQSFGAKSMFYVFANGVVYCVALLMQIYLSISVSNLPFITKANGLVALVVFFILGRLEGAIMNFVFRNMENLIQQSYYMADLEFFGKMVNEYAMLSLMVGIGFILVYFVITHYILNKKLSIR